MYKLTISYLHIFYLTLELSEMDIYLFLPIPVKMIAIHIKEKVKSIIFNTCRSHFIFQAEKYLKKNF